MARRHKYVIRLLIASGVMLAIILALTALKRVGFIAESVFARGISRAYIFVVGNIADLFPFSIFEFLVGTAIIILIVSIVKWIIYLKRKQFYKVGRGVAVTLTVTLAVIMVYTVTASFSYNREDINSHIPMSSTNLDKKAIMNMVNYYTEDFNELAEKMPRDEQGNVVSPYTYKELCEIMQKEMERLDDSYFSKYTPRPKKMISGEIMGAFGILGISFQPTGEANISSHTAAIDLPSLMAHELAHSKGVMRESDAVFVSAYITLTSDNDYVRYSGYCNNFGNIFQILSLHNIKNDYIKAEHALPSKLIDSDYAYRYKEYNKYPNIIEKAGDFFNNVYLKLSGVKEGTDSYKVIGDVTIVKPPNGAVTVIINYSTIQKMIIHRYKTLNINE